MPKSPATSQRKALKGARPKSIAPPQKGLMTGMKRPALGPAAVPQGLPQTPGTAPGMPFAPAQRLPGAGHMSNANNPLGQGVGAGQGNWIAGAIKKPGALHKDLGVPEGKKIPSKKLNAAAKGSGKTAQRARLAKTLKKF